MDGLAEVGKPTKVNEIVFEISNIKWKNRKAYRKLNTKMFMHNFYFICGLIEFSVITLYINR